MQTLTEYMHKRETKKNLERHAKELLVNLLWDLAEQVKILYEELDGQVPSHADIELILKCVDGDL
jgi:hypothetical protein